MKIEDMTIGEVREIASLFTGGRGDIARLSRQFEVSPGQISDIVYGRAWTHVPLRLKK